MKDDLVQDDLVSSQGVLELYQSLPKAHSSTASVQLSRSPGHHHFRQQLNICSEVNMWFKWTFNQIDFESSKLRNIKNMQDLSQVLKLEDSLLEKKQRWCLETIAF